MNLGNIENSPVKKWVRNKHREFKPQRNRGDEQLVVPYPWNGHDPISCVSVNRLVH